MSGYLVAYIIFSIVFGGGAWAIVRGGSGRRDGSYSTDDYWRDQ
jgi:hypothetical protein